MPAADDLPLVDQHCHAVRHDVLDLATFTALASESPWPAGRGTHLDGPVGFALRRWCFPLLGVDRRAPWEEYIERRAQRDPSDVTALMLDAAHTSHQLIDTGYRGAELCSIAEMAALGRQRTVEEICRIEPLAERVAATSSPSTFLADFEAALHAELTRDGVRGIKSVLAYRCGFDLDLVHTTTTPTDIARWLNSGSRMDDPQLCAELVRIAARLGGQLGAPLQFHVGYGDPDIRLHLTNPSLLTPFIEWCQPFDTQIVLLHCWPYQREAGYLATVYPHVWADVGLSLHYSGPSAPQVLSAFFEMTPHTKLLYSSDAFGLADFYATGAGQFRWAIGALLDQWLDAAAINAADAGRIAENVAHANASALYRLS